MSAVGLSLAGALPPANSLAQDGLATPERQEYTPLQAGKDAYFLGEARRLGQINRQVDLNQRMRWQSWPGAYSSGVFEPWPFVPGDIWGYPIYMTTRQSIGQRVYQADANRWISEPVYAQDLATPVAVAQPAANPQLTGVAKPIAARPMVAMPAAATPVRLAAPYAPSVLLAPNQSAPQNVGSPPPGFAPPPGFSPSPEKPSGPSIPPSSSGPREF
jgi:hypothetical protein